MKAIKLTTVQKERLLQMAMFYFTNDVSFQFWVDDEGDTEFIGYSNTYILGGTHYPALVIHWFEFCIKWLMPKMYGRYYYRQGNLIENTLYNKKNPIDVLFDTHLEYLQVHEGISDEEKEK